MKPIILIGADSSRVREADGYTLLSCFVSRHMVEEVLAAVSEAAGPQGAEFRGLKAREGCRFVSKCSAAMMKQPGVFFFLVSSTTKDHVFHGCVEIPWIPISVSLCECVVKAPKLGLVGWLLKS